VSGVGHVAAECASGPGPLPPLAVGADAIVADEAASSPERTAGIAMKSRLIYSADRSVAGIWHACVFGDLFSVLATRCDYNSSDIVWVFVHVRPPASLGDGN
jgi:hypothetical protein